MIRGWRTPVSFTARTELPPLPRKPVYGPAAREEARRLMREPKREKINLGWYTKKNLCRVAKGERPLSYSLCKAIEAHVARTRREREVAARPLQIQVGPGGPRVMWRTLGP